MSTSWWGLLLLLYLLSAQHILGDAGAQAGQASTGEHEVADEEAAAASTPHFGRTKSGQPARSADGKCSASDDKDCPQDSVGAVSAEVEGHRLNSSLHGRPVAAPDEEAADVGFLYARSLSLSVDEGSGHTGPDVNVRGRALRNRVFGQSWCSASQCPVSAALTLSNTTTKHNARKLGQGEAVVACMDCSFSAASVSIVDGEAVCASASSSSMPRGICVAVCQVEGADCSCSAGCSSNEAASASASDSIHTYSYQVTASTGIRDLLGSLHRLMVRVHNTAEHLNMSALLDVPTRSRQVRANIEKRFGRERAKAVPLVFTPANGSGSGSGSTPARR